MTRAARFAGALVLCLGLSPAHAQRDLAELQSAADSAHALKEAGESDSARARYAELIPEIRAAGETSLLFTALRRAGHLENRHGDPELGERLLTERVDLMEASGDSLLLVRAVYDLASGLDGRSRSPRAVPLYERALELAKACGSDVYVARTELRLARRDMRAGDFAEARGRLTRALAGLNKPDVGDDHDRYGAVFLLGILHARQGWPDSARTCWEEVAAWSETAERSMYGQCLINLGRLDVQAGNTALAAEKWQAAIPILIEAGNARSANVAAQNAAIALRELGRLDEAHRILKDQWSLARERGWADYEAGALVNLGEVEQSRHRYASAAEFYRRALQVLETLDDTERRVNALCGLAWALANQDSTAAGVTVMEAVVAEHRDQLGPEKRTQVDQELAEMLLVTGRPAEAETLARRGLAVAREHGYTRETITGLVLLADVERELGDRDGCEGHLREAAAGWEARRQLMDDPEWREVRGHRGSRIFTELADAVLRQEPASEERVEEAYGLLRHYKARTLRERLTESGEADSAFAAAGAGRTARELRREVLRPGDLLLDYYVGPRCSFLFAMTPDTVRVFPLPGRSDELFEGIARYHELASAPPAGDSRDGAEALLEGAAASLGRSLLERPMAGVGECRRIVFVPDGPLHLLSLASLHWQGAPLVEACEIVRVPSSEFLEDAGGAGTATDAVGAGDTRTPASLLAIAGRLGEGSRELQGTVHEVESLGRRFEHVEILMEPAPGEAAIAAGELAEHQVLHFAAHTNVDDQRPWNSGIRLGGRTSDAPAENDPTEDNTFLRASTIASLELPARLAVLSGCESAGGRVVTGEGALGLTSAFLCAGVPAVVATLWPVDDRVTPRLMEEFYEGLARGETAAAALRAAQRELRKDPATRLPFYWAGFALVGEADLRIDLEARSGPDRPAWLLVLGGAVLLVILLYTLLRFGRRHPTSGGLPWNEQP